MIAIKAKKLKLVFSKKLKNNESEGPQVPHSLLVASYPESVSRSLEREALPGYDWVFKFVAKSVKYKKLILIKTKFIKSQINNFSL